MPNCVCLRRRHFSHIDWHNTFPGLSADFRWRTTLEAGRSAIRGSATTRCGVPALAVILKDLKGVDRPVSVGKVAGVIGYVVFARRC